MKVKVCGMTDVDQIEGLVSLGVDFAGLIFYEKSPRYVAEKIDTITLQSLSQRIKLTGVFVNENAEKIKEMIDSYHLSAVQLCGSEPVDLCDEIRRYAEVIKVIHVGNDNDFSLLAKRYYNHCDYFLFDTQSDKYGGSGKKFSWESLSEYSFSKPFFLSGGISADDADAIKTFSHPDFFGIDLNSRFEVSAGNKDLNKIKTFINQLNIV